jgi:hypothetical protein
MRPALLSELEQRARDRGLDLFGVVDTYRFDKAQPPENRCAREFAACGTAIVVGCGGKAGAAPSAIGELLRLLRAAGLRARAAGAVRSSISFACLSEAAGFGTVSPVIQRLLHPRYGPWVSVSAVLLVEGQPFGPIADASIAGEFQPCSTCSRPCIAACPADVHDGKTGSQFDRCHDHRQGGGCSTGCHVVRMCPVGADQRMTEDNELEWHRRESLRLARRYGRGLLWSLRRTFGL